MAEGELDLSAVMSRLMNDKNVAELIQSIKSNAENPEQGTSENEKPTKETAVFSEEKGSTEDMITSDMIEKLPEVMSAIAPLMKNGTLKGGKHNSETEKRNRLLSALKPYMNESRCSMIDSIMALSKLTGLMDILPGGNK